MEGPMTVQDGNGALCASMASGSQGEHEWRGEEDLLSNTHLLSNEQIAHNGINI